MNFHQDNPVPSCTLLTPILLTILAVYVQIASVRSDGAPKIQRLVFQDFLSQDPKVLIFSAATRAAELMAVVKGSGMHEIYWCVVFRVHV